MSIEEIGLFAVPESEYEKMLSSVHHSLLKNYPKETFRVLIDKDEEKAFLPLVSHYFTTYLMQSGVTNLPDVKPMAMRIYNDLTNFGPISKYLSDSSVVEFVIGSYSSMQIIYGDHSVWCENEFSSPQDCAEMVRKLLRYCGVELDSNSPPAVSVNLVGFRIRAAVMPTVSEMLGATATISKRFAKSTSKEGY